ncbi:MAG TPA: basic secretory protein-like protein [Verrucomicrobiae bacterium]
MTGSFPYKFLLIITALFLLQAGSVSAADPIDFIGTIDTSRAPEMRNLAADARRIANAAYPRIKELFASLDSKFPKRFDITFEKKLKRDNRGVTHGNKITLSAEWLAQNPNSLGYVLTHEIAHVAQNYKWYRAPKTPFYWVEGLADYACYKIGETNDWWCPECGAEYPHYTSGYRCTVAFLLFLDATFGPAIVRQLNQALARGTFSESFFRQNTGSSLDQLWLSFQKTAAFKPEAVGAYKLQQTLGLAGTRPGKNISDRAMAFLKKKPGGALTLAAGEYLHGLFEKDKLPGFARKDAKKPAGENRFTLGLEANELLRAAESDALPATRCFYGQVNKEQTKLYYVVVRESKDSSWRLQKAWRGDGKGQIVEEFSVK